MKRADLLDDAIDPGLGPGRGAERIGGERFPGERQGDGAYTLGKDIWIVAALERVDDPTPAVRMSNPEKRPPESVVAHNRQLQAGEGIAPMSVETCGNEKDLWPKPLGEGGDHALGDLGKGMIAGAAGERNVHDRPASWAGAGVVQGAGAGVNPALVCG